MSRSWRLPILAGISVLPFLGGCATFVSSEPVGKDSSGIEYALCLPTIVATPQVDGSVAFEKACIPDPERRYAISGKTVFGDLTLKVTRRKDMLLTGFTVDRDDSAVAVSSVEAAGALAQKRLEVLAAAEADKKKAQKDDVDAAKADLKAANAAVDSARIDLANVEEELNSLLSLKGLSGRDAKTVVGDSAVATETREEVRSAWLKVREKQVALEAAEAVAAKAQKALIATQPGTPSANSANAPEDTESAGTKEVWGPVAYRVEQTVDNRGELVSVRLVNMFEQPKFKTVNVSPPPATDTLSVKITEAVARRDGTGAVVVTVTLDNPVDEALTMGTFLQPIEPPRDRYEPTSAPVLNDTSVTVTFEPTLPDGEYVLGLDVKKAGKDGSLRSSVTIGN